MRFLLLAAFALLTVAASLGQPRSDTVHVVIKTEKGDIELELYPKKAPKTVANFLRYVKAGHYTGGVFHRTVTMGNQPDKKIKIEVIQGGPNPKAGKDFAPIKLERTNKTGVLHVDGAISMARDGADT